MFRRIPHPLFAAVSPALLALTLSGCGVIKVSGLPGGGGGGGASGGGPGGVLGIGAAYDEGAAEKGTLATFKAWTFESCDASYTCVGAFKKQAGITEYRDKATYVYQYNPRRTLKNPDPAWLPEWDKMSEDEHLNTADETYQALLVAAGRRTWLARCHADFASLDGAWRANDATWAKDIDAAAKATNPYARIDGLLALQKRALEASNNDHQPSKTNVGYLTKLYTSIKLAYEGTGRDYLFAIEGPTRNMQAARPRLAADVERDLYCFNAASRGTATTPALPAFARGDSYTERGAKYVKPLFTEAQREQLAKLAEDEQRKFAATLTPAKISDAWGEAVFNGKGEIAGHPKLAHMADYGEIKKIGAEGGKQVLEIIDHHEGEYPYDCVETNKFDHWDGNGRAVYRSICQYGKSVDDLAVKITVGAELPPGVTFQVGDRIEGWATVLGHTDKTTVNTKPLTKRAVTWAYELQHLKSLTRKGKSVGRWW